MRKTSVAGWFFTFYSKDPFLYAVYPIRKPFVATTLGLFAVQLLSLDFLNLMGKDFTINFTNIDQQNIYFKMEIKYCIKN